MEVTSDLSRSIYKASSYLQNLKWRLVSLEGDETPEKQRDHYGSSHNPITHALFCYCGMKLFFAICGISVFWMVINGDDFQLLGWRLSDSPQNLKFLSKAQILKQK